MIVTLQLLMETLVALLHLLLVPDQCGQAVQRTRVQVVGVTPHDATQRLRLTDHLRPRLTRKRLGGRGSLPTLKLFMGITNVSFLKTAPGAHSCCVAHLAHSADIIGSFLLLRLLSHAKQQSGVLFVALHSQGHEALHRLEQLRGEKTQGGFLSVACFPSLQGVGADLCDAFYLSQDSSIIAMP